MKETTTAEAMLDREFLDIRCRLIDIASAMDRIGRGAGAEAVASDSRMQQLSNAAAILIDGQPDRAARVQMIFSDDYDPSWRDE